RESELRLEDGFAVERAGARADVERDRAQAGGLAPVVRRRRALRAAPGVVARLAQRFGRSRGGEVLDELFDARVRAVGSTLESARDARVPDRALGGRELFRGDPAKELVRE